MFWTLLLHPIEIFGQIIFTMESIHSRKMIDFLMWLHFRQSINCYCTVMPLHIPIFCIIILDFPIQLFSNSLNYFILSITQIKQYRLGNLLLFILSFMFRLCVNIRELDRTMSLRLKAWGTLFYFLHLQ